MSKTGLILSALVATTLAGVSAPAFAADLPAKPVYKALMVDVWNPWMIRVRALGVITRNSGSVDQVAGSSLTVSDAVVPELDITYFFTKNIAAELVLGTTRHTVSVTAPPVINGLTVGSAWLLPPILTLQYHFTDFGAWKPYVGAGVNYTFFYSQSAGGNTVNGFTVTSSSLQNAGGVALQAGFDYMLDRHWGFNVDVKKLYLSSNWSGTIAGLGAATGKVNLDPWLIGAGVVYKF